LQKKDDAQRALRFFLYCQSTGSATIKRRRKKKTKLIEFRKSE